MIRTQIQLTESQARRIRDIAKEQGISVAEAIRRCLDQQLDAAEPPRTDRYANAARAIGQFHDAHGASDLAESHDAYLVLPSE